MFGLTRWTFALLMIVLSGIFAGLTVGWAQSPPAETEPPAQKKIRVALQGEQVEADSGDVVLDDILRVIRQQGSVLDGSVLDPKACQSSLLKEDSLADAPPPASSQEEISQRAYTAELLLLTSRRLEQIGAVDKTRKQLVAEMRDEAARLLSH
ncbi:MAG: hypothetical protein MI861_27570 [Pirellulales bacterium]|nr:hypothetical protein [Pirellulales bacterium]